MPITPQSFYTNVGASVAIDVPTSGDVILVFAGRTNATAPSLPAGYTNIFTDSISSPALSYRVGYKISNGTETNSDTWTNATCLIVAIYRGSDMTTPDGIRLQNKGATTSLVIWPRIAQLTDANNTAWVLAGSLVPDGYPTPSVTPSPANLTTRASTIGLGTEQIVWWDTNAGVGAWAEHTATNSIGGSPLVTGWLTWVIEFPVRPLVYTTSFRDGAPATPLPQRRKNSLRAHLQETIVSTPFALYQSVSMPGTPLIPMPIQTYDWPVPQRRRQWLMDDPTPNLFLTTLAPVQFGGPFNEWAWPNPVRSFRPLQESESWNYPLFYTVEWLLQQAGWAIESPRARGSLGAWLTEMLEQSYPISVLPLPPMPFGHEVEPLPWGMRRDMYQLRSYEEVMQLVLQGADRAWWLPGNPMQGDETLLWRGRRHVVVPEGEVERLSLALLAEAPGPVVITTSGFF